MKKFFLNFIRNLAILVVLLIGCILFNRKFLDWFIKQWALYSAQC